MKLTHTVPDSERSARGRPVPSGKRDATVEGAIMATEAVTSASSIDGASLLIGRNSGGGWVVRDQAGRRGGLFVSLADAQRYVRMETLGRAAGVTMVPGCLSLE